MQVLLGSSRLIFAFQYQEITPTNSFACEIPVHGPVLISGILSALEKRASRKFPAVRYGMLVCLFVILTVADFGLKHCCRIKLELARWQLATCIYTQLLFKVPYVFEVFPYQEQWKRVTTIES